MLQATNADMVQDIIHVCQGINGRLIMMPTAEGAAGQSYCLTAEGQHRLSAAQRSILMQLCELGWQYRYVACSAPNEVAGELAVYSPAGWQQCCRSAALLTAALPVRTATREHCLPGSTDCLCFIKCVEPHDCQSSFRHPGHWGRRAIDS